MLQSCIKDHNFPSPGGAVIPPILPLGEGYSIDWNDAAKTVITTGIEMIPEAGEILGPLVDIFWPKSGEDVWSQVKNQVIALVTSQITDEVYGRVTGNLAGLKNVSGNYLNEINNFNAIIQDDPTKDYGKTLRDYWIDLSDDFDLYLPNFQEQGFELPLLGLFAQFANMHLSVLRDMVISGKKWGFTDKQVQDQATKLTASIQKYQSWVDEIGGIGRSRIVNSTKRNDHNCEPFRTVNHWDREMSFKVFYFRDAWPYFDATVYPNGSKDRLTREIYTDPMGTCDNSGNIVMATPTATQFPTNLSVWGGDRVNAVQLTYPANSGPGGVTQTKRMGANGGSNQGNLPISPNNPITLARVTFGDIVNSMQFVFNDGTTTNDFGGKFGSQGAAWQYANMALSSMHINGVSGFYGSADCIVFGFQYWNSPAEALNAIRAIYIRSPKERSAADFAKALPHRTIPADLITNELRAARRAHWDYIKSIAK
ncbi:insecticidal delta-endotoxin Cry8Ea1 family protein [Larkinella harenae]